MESLDALRGLYWQTEKHERLLDVLEQLALRATDDRDAVSLLHEKARLIERYFPRQDTASVYERILELDPQEATALEARDRIYSVRADNAGARGMRRGPRQLPPRGQLPRATIRWCSNSRRGGSSVSLFRQLRRLPKMTPSARQK